MHKNILIGIPRRRDHLEDMGVDGKILLLKRMLREIEWEAVDWIHLPWDRYQWRALINTVLNLRVPLKAGNFLNS
jgi:hypothetical protein